MAKAKDGDTVRVHYIGKFKDEEEFDNSYDGDPLEFTIGREEVIPGFEEGVVGMEPGEKKEILIPPDKAYGYRGEDLIGDIDPEIFPDDMNMEVGTPVRLTMKEGEDIMAVILDVQDDRVTVDANHPLAGQELKFSLELLEIT